MQFNRRNLAVAGGVLGALILVIVLVIVLGGDDGDDATEPTTTTTSTITSTTTTSTTVPAGPVLPLTGLPAGDDEDALDRPAIVVKISNNPTTVQRSGNWRGLHRADVVIEEQIEAQATRFAAIFHSDLPDAVGPIRSGRTTDVDLLTNLGGPILVYSGANGFVTGQLRTLQNDGLVTLVVDRGTNVDLVRDTDFGKPDNLFSDLGEIQEKYGEQAGAATPIFTYLDTDDARPAGTSGPGVAVEAADDVAFVWDETRGYVRVQNGEVHTTLDGDPLVFDNIVVLEVAYTPNPNTPGSVDAQTVGSGPVTILAGGERRTGTWTRDDRTDTYRFVDADGEPLPLEPGTTWMTLVRSGSYGFDLGEEIVALVLGSDG